MIINTNPKIVLPRTSHNIKGILYPPINALIDLIKKDYQDCPYHSIITLNQQYFKEEIAEKILRHMITNMYQQYYGKHCSLKDKPQMKFMIIPEQGKLGKDTHYHMIHSPIEARFSYEKIEPFARNFITLTNTAIHGMPSIGKDKELIDKLYDDYVLYNTNAILTRSLKKVVKKGNVETKRIVDEYHFDNLCNYVVKEMDPNHIIYYPDTYFSKIR